MPSMDIHELRLWTDEVFDLDTTLFVSIEIMRVMRAGMAAEGRENGVDMLDRHIRIAEKGRILLNDAYSARRPN